MFPAIIFSYILFLCHSFIPNNYWRIRFGYIDALWWGSSVPIFSHAGLGPMWFLLSLFWSKVIIDIVNILFPRKFTTSIYILIGVLGIILGTEGKYLPQNMDVNFVAVFFCLYRYALEKIR